MKLFYFLILCFLSANIFADRISEIERILDKHKDKPYFSKSAYLQGLVKERDSLLANQLKENTKQVVRNINDFSPPKVTGDCFKKSDLKSHNKIGCQKNSTQKVPLEMGINLTAPQAESPAVGNSIPFANIFKTARPFETLSPDLVIDQNGHPCFKDTNQEAKTNLLQSAMPGSIPNGIYPVHIKGDVELKVKGAKLINCPQSKSLSKGYERKCLHIQIPKKLNGQGLLVSVKGKKAGACLEDLKIILPGGNPNYEDEVQKGKMVFNQDYINYLKPFKVLRMMNFMYASPRLPEACRKIQQKEIQANPGKYNWNNLSQSAKDCILAPTAQRTLQNRAKVHDASWGVSYNTDKRKWRGVPIEVSVELARQTGGDPWINIPHNASPEYIRELARQFSTLKKDHPNMKFHVEYSNEVWNGRFWGAKAMQAAKKDPYPNEDTQGLQKQLNSLRNDWIRQKDLLIQSGRQSEVKALTERMNEKMGPIRQKIEAKQQAEVDVYVERSVEAFKIFEDEIGKESLVRTLGTNQKDPNRTRRMLKALKKNGDLNKVDAVATATYFHGCWGSSPLEGGACQKYLKSGGGKGLFSSNSAQEILKTLADPKNPEGVHHVIDQVKAQKAVLDSPDFKDAGISLVSYEGGQHLTIDNMPADLKKSLSPEKKKELIKMFHEANNSPLMGDLYEKLFKGWKEAGGKSHVNFIMAQGQSQYGSFGLSSSLKNKDSSPKYNQAKKFAQEYCNSQAK